MKIHPRFSIFIFALFFFCGFVCKAQSIYSQKQKSLFESDDILDITLYGNMRELINDRSDASKYHAVKLSYKSKDSADVFLNTEIKTRGHFRKLKENCQYPPLLIHFFNSDTLKSSIFNKQDKLKLVMPCGGDEYVIHEWLVYKLYNLVTPVSFKARLVSIRLNDIKSNKVTSAFYGILLEEDKEMAKRNNLVLVNKTLKPQQTDHDAFLKMAVFEYLIGNTDWSVQYLQNIKLVAKDTTAVCATVPYDFDHAGIVNAPYAKPAEELEMSSVRERRYRGFCITDMKRFDDVIALYNSLKNDIYATYNNCFLLDAKYVKATIKYLDQFYATINNANSVKKEFQYPCDPSGTGNIIIKGLKN